LIHPSLNERPNKDTSIVEESYSLSLSPSVFKISCIA